MMACTLTLISSSATRKQSPDSSTDLCFDINVHSLPKFSVTEIWNKEIGNPLRDRIMIKWLFSYSAAQEQLDNMMRTITDEIQKRLPATSPPATQTEIALSCQEHASNQEPTSGSVQLTCTQSTPANDSSRAVRESMLTVIVTCPNGLHYSPCFVETLRETYQNEGKLNKQLMIITKHWDVSPKKKTKYSWSKTKIPCSYIRHVEMLTNDRLWVPFDDQLSDCVEQAFQEDHYSSFVHDGTNVIDLEPGTLYDKQKRKTYYIRSAVLPDKERSATVKCQLLGDEGYKFAVKLFNAAGILFYSVHPQTGEAVFLLGHMTYGSCSWCDFGGLKSFRKFPPETVGRTAARECYEETQGVLGSSSALQGMLKDNKTNNVFKVVNQAYNYVEHFLRVPFKDYQKMFDGVVKSFDVLEIDKIRWFTMSSLREAVQMTLSNVQAINVSHLNDDGTPSPRECMLRIEFTHTLCIAEKLGILDSIDYITRQLHLNSSAPPLKPISYPKPVGTVKSAISHETPQQEVYSLTVPETSQQETDDPSDNKSHSSLDSASESPHQAITNREGIHAQCLDCSDSEMDDLVSRSQVWSFEEFVAGLPSEAVGSEAAAKQSIRQRKGKEAGKKGKKLPKCHPTVNGRPVLYYGMGAGRFED